MTLPTILIVVTTLLILAAIARRYRPKAVQRRVVKWAIDAENMERGNE